MSGGSINLSALSLTHVIPSQGFYRYAVASLGDEVFVACHNSQDIAVYDAGSFTLRRRLTVPGLGSLCYGLAACISNNCLYASDYENSGIHRVGLSGGSAVIKWSVAGHPAGLSVNKAHNVVVTCCQANKLLEYTTHGTLVREISLQQTGLTSPWHAVQLSTGHYVVCHCTYPGVVSVVGVDGQVVRRYRQSRPSKVGQMNSPRSLAVTKNNEIVVGDIGNNRILSMNSSLSSIQALALSVDGGIQQPWGLCLDESRGRLYVSEYGRPIGDRVLVFENKDVRGRPQYTRTRVSAGQSTAHVRTAPQCDIDRLILEHNEVDDD